MQASLNDLIDKYAHKISEKQAIQYVPMLKNYFVPYIIDNYSCNNLKSLFCEEITRNGIIQSGVYYVMHNENVSAKSRLIYFLNALDSFWQNTLFEMFPNPNIRGIYPFTSLQDEIVKILNKKGIYLYDKKQNPPIDDEQYIFLMDTIKNKNDSVISKQKNIIIKLYLLYGLSADKLSKVLVSKYSGERNVLMIPCSVRTDVIIHIELPYGLSKEISTYISERGLRDDDFLFLTENGNAVTSNYIDDYLKNIRKAYYKGVRPMPENQFTPTGLQKYAIIKMIEEGMNQSIIMDFTGQGSDIFSDCQNIVDERKHLNRNRYINHMMRGIASYDDM